jgi:hypothetical protein
MTKALEYFKLPEELEEQWPTTSSEAKKIIGLFKQGKDETTIFVENGVARYKIEEAKKEWLRLKKEVYKRVQGEFVTKEAIPAEYDKDGVETKPEVPAEYYTPTTKTDIQTKLSSSTLFAAIDVVNDILAYDEKTPWSPQTFTQFRDKYYTL